MTHFQLLKEAEEILRNSGIDDVEFDCWCLFRKVFLIEKSEYYLVRHKEADVDKMNEFLSLVEERKNTRPLQYILGEWEFMDYTFKVGEGVLIPRQDTETLVERVREYIIKNNSKIVYDLCSGSGCIGISLAKMFDDITVYCFELSDNAIKYLEENKKLNNADNVKIVKGDIKNGYEYFSLPSPDVVVSNPPYIISEEIKTLQSEVLKEPEMALDGGEDGYDFYRIINEKWFSHCKDNTFLAVECGENQAYEIEKMFSRHSSVTEICKDYNNIERVVTALKQR